jgi:hypothetical protein
MIQQQKEEHVNDIIQSQNIFFRRVAGLFVSNYSTNSCGIPTKSGNAQRPVRPDTVRCDTFTR